MMKKEMESRLHGWKPALTMVLVEIALAGVTILYKLAVDIGMNLRVLVVYRLLFSTVSSLPLALIFERESVQKLTWMVFFLVFLCGLFGGALAQNMYVESLALTSATYVSAMTNLVPAITFILCVCFRLEKVRLGRGGKGKMIGTVVGIGGVMVLTFYRGIKINIPINYNLLKNNSWRLSTQPRNLAWGCMLALGNCFSNALWYITQAKLGEIFPYFYSIAALMSLLGLIQAAIFALCMERNWNDWKIGWDMKLFIVAYSGIVGFGVTVTLIAWCVQVRDPVYVAAFNPLLLLLVVFMGTVALDENLFLGRIVGAILIVTGLYIVLWGKHKEDKEDKEQRKQEDQDESDGVELL